MDNPEYVRRRIAGEDIAFRRDNLAWNVERPQHLLECIGICLRLLTVDKFAEFHSSKAEEFNTTCEKLELLKDNDQNWFDQPDHIDGLKTLLDLVIHLCLDIVDLVQRV
jgi:hypothetical protein